MSKNHLYKTRVTWTGNKGSGTMDYRSYDRDYMISIDGKIDIPGSSDSIFLGDKSKYNPEDLLLASVSSCHMLWYLHLCSKNEVVVIEYKDEAVGMMEEVEDGSGKFKEITLFPKVIIADKAHLSLAQSLHKEANKMCFIANSLNFPIEHKPEIKAENA
ncbi:organic hydroperoxide reductase OsmC/OhrA [Pedobacter sp. UYP30]|uniref:OsmC family protein n=1 Tax=Pedobacter sp. UYP30 TaxID=1756400 RepID=UPI0033991082